MNSSCGIFICLLGVLLHPSVAPCSDLELKAEVVEAMEGGPFVIKATLTNRSKSPIEIQQRTHDLPNISFDILTRGKGKSEAGQRTRDMPKQRSPDVQNMMVIDGWKYRVVIPTDMRVIMGARPGIAGETLQAGESRTELIFVHHRLIDIPAMKVTVKVSWDVGKSRDAKGVAIATPSIELPVDILPATPANLTSLRTRLEKRVRAEERAPKVREPLAYTLLYTKHRALVPVACQMLASRNSINPVYELNGLFPLARDLIEFVHENAEPADANRRFVDLVEKMSSSTRLAVFGYWRNHRTELPATELQKLQDSSDIWIRVMAYSCFHKQYTPARIETLLAAVREQTTPIPALQLRRLLSRLDDDDFEVRQRASAEMVILGTRIEGQLDRIRKADVSPEIWTRIQVVSKRSKEGRPSSPAAVLVEHALKSERAPDRAVLLALAGGDPDCWLTREAKKTLSREKQAFDGGPR